MSTGAERLQWRRDKVLELSSQGRSQPQIARILQIGLGTVNRDLQHLRQKAKENIKRYIDEKLPEEYEKTLCGINSILREAWTISQSKETGRTEKIKALNLAKDCYAMKLDLLTNATVIDDAIRFVRIDRNLNTHDNDITNDGVRDKKPEPSKQKGEPFSESKERVLTVNKVF